MKILLGNNTLALLAGSETHTLTLAKELKNEHEISCYSPLLGEIARQLRKEGIECFNEPQGEYDLILANHYDIVETLRERYPNTSIISTIHGIMHEMDGKRLPEYPNIKADKFVAVSEEVQYKLKNDYGLESTIIRNFFEIKEEPINDTPKKILFNSNYNKKDDEVFKLVVELAKHYNAELLAIGKNFYETPNIDLAVKSSDIVIGIGRSVLEGMARGRLGIVHGRWGIGGVICGKRVNDLRKVNFSGRGGDSNLKEIIEDIDLYYKDIRWRMDYMENHNVVKATQEYLCLSDLQK